MHRRKRESHAAYEQPWLRERAIAEEMRKQQRRQAQALGRQLGRVLPAENSEKWAGSVELHGGSSGIYVGEGLRHRIGTLSLSGDKCFPCILSVTSSESAFLDGGLLPGC